MRSRARIQARNPRPRRGRRHRRPSTKSRASRATPLWRGPPQVRHCRLRHCRGSRCRPCHRHRLGCCPGAGAADASARPGGAQSDGGGAAGGRRRALARSLRSTARYIEPAATGCAGPRADAGGQAACSSPMPGPASACVVRAARQAGPRRGARRRPRRRPPDDQRSAQRIAVGPPGAFSISVSDPRRPERAAWNSPLPSRLPAAPPRSHTRRARSQPASIRSCSS